MASLEPIVVIEALCTAAEEFPVGVEEIHNHSRPVLKVADRCYVCMLETGGQIISPSSQAMIVIRAMDDGSLVKALAVTDVLELLGGQQVIAYGRVLNYRSES